MALSLTYFGRFSCPNFLSHLIRRESVLSAFVIFIALSWSFTLVSGILSDITGGIAVVVWILQYYLAQYTYDVRVEIAAGGGKPPIKPLVKSEAIKIPASVRRFSCGLYRAIQGQVKPGEILQHAVSNSTHFIGLTDKHLILITRYFFGKPAIVYSFTINQIQSVFFKPGTFYDFLAFDFGNRGDATFNLVRGIRRETQAIVDEISARKSENNPL